MDIFSYFRRKGIDTLDATFYRKIEEWKSWYNGNVRNFLFIGYTPDREVIQNEKKNNGYGKESV